MSSCDTFTLFISLPSELKSKIWEFCLPNKRVVSVRFNRISKQYNTTSPPHPLLHTCSLSRQTYLRTYTNLILSPKYPSSIYLNFNHDTLFFDALDCSPDGDLALDLATSPHRDRIQRLAISVELWEVLRVFRWDGLSEVRSLGGLKLLALILTRDEGLVRTGRVVGGGTDNGTDRRVLRVGGEGEGTWDQEITQSIWYVENLRGELERSVGENDNWGKQSPNVQLWLW